jgi:hypothetical protein
MTIKDLKEGKVFKYSSGKFILSKVDDDTYCIIKNYGSYVANVSKIGSKKITAYTYVMDKKVNLTINIKDCEEV